MRMGIMEKIEVCFLRLYPDNPGDALIIAGLAARRRKGGKSRVIKDMLYAYFSREQGNSASAEPNKNTEPS